MMDSQENTLGQEKTEEQNVAPADNSVQTDTDNTNNADTEAAATPEATAPVNADAAEEGATEPKKAYKSKKEVIERLKEIAGSDDDPQSRRCNRPQAPSRSPGLRTGEDEKW